MRRPMVAGNWKMHGSRAQLEQLLGAVVAGVSRETSAEVLVCPAYIYLQAAATLVSGTPVALGAQNVSDKPEGAFTGEIAAGMLTDVGCQYVLVGHSERRALYAETDSAVAAKFVAAQAAGLVPVLCVGETLEEREAGHTEAVVARQLGALLELAGVGALKKAVLAYEPVWAIGTGLTATPARRRKSMNLSGELWRRRMLK